MSGHVFLIVVSADYYYSLHSKKDHWLKYVAATSAAAVAIHIGFITAVQWILLVQRWGDPSVYGVKGPWQSGLGPLTSALSEKNIISF